MKLVILLFEFNNAGLQAFYMRGLSMATETGRLGVACTLSGNIVAGIEHNILELALAATGLRHTGVIALLV